MQIGDQSYDYCINFNYKILSEELCDNLIKYYEAKKHCAKRSEVTDGKDTSRLDASYRDSNEFIPWGGGMLTLIRDAINPIVEKYIEHYPEFTQTLSLETWYEPSHIVHYDSSEAHYDWHFDKFVNDDTGTDRMLSILIYLNDVAEGGETEFKFFERSFKPSKGSVLIFPSEWMYLDRGLAPRDGDKYLCVTWLRNYN